MMRPLLLTTLSLVVLLAVPCLAQEEDTILIPPPEMDTSRTVLPSEADTSRFLLPSGDTVLVDTLKEVDRAMLEFERRQAEYQEQERVIRKPEFSFFDSLVSYYTSPRLDQRDQIDRATYHSAADYLRFSPSYVVREHQATPMRSTVQPFGLSGNRVNIISNRITLEPFEHIVEPDGLTDFSDVPTALDKSLYVLPGAAGLLFGGRQATATLVTMPARPKSYEPETGILVDQGSFDYNHIRGRYSKVFSNSREIDMSVGYRNADGIMPHRDDDAYHYTGRIFQPIGQNYGISASGWLYSREGSFVVRPDRGGAVLSRHRADRSGEISLDRQNSNHDARYAFGYRYLKQSSHIDGAYKGRFDKKGWGAFMSREWLGGSTLAKSEINSFHTEYNNGSENFVRDRGQAYLSIANTSAGLRYALRAGTQYIDGFGLLPDAAVVFSSDGSALYVLLSLGYAQRAPTLLELHLPVKQVQIYGSGVPDYADKGNPQLTQEKQLVVSGLVEWGSPETNLRLTITGGKIRDAIDWQDYRIVGAEGVYRLFKPVNENIDFTDFSLEQKLRLKDFLRLRSGAALHSVTYETVKTKPYSPDFQLFSGLELHYYWPQKIMDLFAYGELAYQSEYEGYDRKGLGKELIANVKLSFRIKDFRFYYAIQNALSNVYEPREYMINPGRYNCFGFEWNFSG